MNGKFNIVETFDNIIEESKDNEKVHFLNEDKLRHGESTLTFNEMKLVVAGEYKFFINNFHEDLESTLELVVHYCKEHIIDLSFLEISEPTLAIHRAEGNNLSICNIDDKFYNLNYFTEFPLWIAINIDDERIVHTVNLHCLEGWLI